MTTQTEALKLALEALETIQLWMGRRGYELVPKEKAAITAIKEALSSPNGEAQPEQPTPKWQGVRFDSALHDQSQQPKELEQRSVSEHLEQVLDALTIVRFCVPPAQRSTIERAIETTIEALAQPERTWVGLNDDDKKQIAKAANYNFEMTTGEYAERIGRLTEEKLKELNT